MLSVSPDLLCNRWPIIPERGPAITTDCLAVATPHPEADTGFLADKSAYAGLFLPADGQRPTGPRRSEGGRDTDCTVVVA